MKSKVARTAFGPRPSAVGLTSSEFRGPGTHRNRPAIIRWITTNRSSSSTQTMRLPSRRRARTRRPSMLDTGGVTDRSRKGLASRTRWSVCPTILELRAWRYSSTSGSSGTGTLSGFGLPAAGFRYNRWMMRSMRLPSVAALAALALLSGTAVLVAAKIKVEAQRAANANFEVIKTYTWLPSPPPMTDVAPGVMRDPKVVQAELDPIIVAAVDREFTTRGITKVAEGGDVQVVYYLSHGTSMATSTMGSYYQYATDFYVGGVYGGQTTYAQVIEEGSIVARHRRRPPRHLARHGQREDQPRERRREAPEGDRRGHAEDVREVPEEVARAFRPARPPTGSSPQGAAAPAPERTAAR